MILAFFEHPDGIEARPGNRVVYEVASNDARFGNVGARGHALVWELSEYGARGAKLAAEVAPDPAVEWLVRCDRVDFPPEGVAHRHVHPGPGIRYLLQGSLIVETGGETRTLGPGDAWFESGPEPVYAVAGDAETAFVRVMLLPREWVGRRTIRYVDPADEDEPKTQRATILLEQPVELA
jgi:quercetin dioxygenase-like cupin family protein